MNKIWIKHDDISTISAFELAQDGIGQIGGTVPNRFYLNVYLRGGQTVTLDFNSEDEQKKAYEVYKPE